MFNLAAAGNVEVPAYLALQARGYRVTRTYSDEDQLEFWYAETTGERFTASGPLELLGLVALYETRGENWRAEDEQIEDFLKHYT